jgi:parallel beta-helix repeat protein
LPASAGWDNEWRGEVRLAATVAIPRGCSLTILPGTTVLLSPGASIGVKGGRLVASGTDDSPVRFLPASPGERWGGISFAGAAEGSLLSRAVVEGAESVSMEDCSVPVRDCLFTGGRIALVLGSGAAPPVERNEIRAMEEGGVACDRDAHPLVAGNAFVRCAEWGIYSQEEARPAIRGNSFLRCGEAIHVKGSLGAPLSGNRFTANRGGVVAEGTRSGIRISGNRFEGNETALVCLQHSHPEVEGNRFVGNGAAVRCVRFSSPAIRRNNLSGNGEGVSCTGMSTPRLEGNDFRDNDRAVVLDTSSYAVIRGNNFEGGGSRVVLLDYMSADWEHRVRNKPVRGWAARLRERTARGAASAATDEPPAAAEDTDALDGTVDATGNWWGKETTAEMEAKGADGNISSIVDGHDVPVRRYGDDPEEYVQDRVNYSGWAKGRISGTGADAAPTEGGTP